MGSTFSSTFENIHREYRAVGSTFNSAFKPIHTLNIKLWDRHSALHSKTFVFNIEHGIDFQLCIQNHTHFEYQAMGSTSISAFKTSNLEYRTVESTFTSAIKTIHTLIIELWVRHSALHSKPFILNTELCDQYLALHSKSYTI